MKDLEVFIYIVIRELEIKTSFFYILYNEMLVKNIDVAINKNGWNMNFISYD